MIENFTFDLQRFKGNTTVENRYEPTEYELEGQRIASNYAGAVAPNALLLNNYAAQILASAFPTVVRGADQMYSDLLTQSRDRQNDAMDSMVNSYFNVGQAINDNRQNLQSLLGGSQNMTNAPIYDLYGNVTTGRKRRML